MIEGFTGKLLDSLTIRLLDREKEDFLKNLRLLRGMIRAGATNDYLVETIEEMIRKNNNGVL